MLLSAALHARKFVESVKRDAGEYDIDGWPAVREERRFLRPNAGTAVVWLRTAQRRMMGFLDPVDDAIFLTAGLRHLGISASFHIGRELVPLKPPAGLFAWVQHESEVVSTSLPVREIYREIHRAE